jgi:hypothetical protein
MIFGIMKWKLLLCVAVLAVAGCASNQQDPYASYGELGFSSDLIPPPVVGLTPAEVEVIYGSPVVSPSTVYGQSN